MATAVGTINMPGEMTIVVAGVYSGTITFDLPVGVGTTQHGIRQALAAAIREAADQMDAAPTPADAAGPVSITVDGVPLEIAVPILPSAIMRRAGIAMPERYDLAYLVDNAAFKVMPEAIFMPSHGAAFITAAKAATD